MIWNQKQFEASSENKQSELVEEVETVEEPIVTENTDTEEVPEPEVKKTIVKKKENAPKKEKTIVNAETVTEAKETKSPKVDLALENRILKQSLLTGFDAELLTALVLKDIQSSEDGTDNLEELVTQYVEKYPQMLKQSNKPKPTEGIAPAKTTQQKDKVSEQRSRYFGNGNSNFFTGQGVINN